MAEIMVKPECRKPNAEGWRFLQFCDAGMAYQHSNGVAAISSVCWVNDDHEPEYHWEWLVSFSMAGQLRLNDEEIKPVLKDWDLGNFEEDNHEPGIARKFWLAAEHRFRKPCPCKDEEMVTEGGYVWSRKKAMPLDK